MRKRFISIPQGSIKSSFRMFDEDNLRAFQFHKVRLKELKKEAQRIAKAISIPQGSIKRFKSASAATVEVIFQFHKVRLKVDDGYRCWTPNKLFQFHKVRLKDTDFAPLPLTFIDFNSTRFD